MWTSPLFRLRAALTEPRSLLGSWQLSVVLMVGGSVFYVLLAIYSWTVPSHVVGSIAALAVYWILWTLILVNTVFCLWNRWRSAAWHSILFHGAFFVVFTGMLLSIAWRQESKIWVAEGEEFAAASEQFLTRGGAAVPPRFTLRSITAEFWRDQLLFTRLEAVLDANGSARTTRINRPLWIPPARFLRLSGFGFAPRYEIVDRQGRVLESAFVKLNVFPPGQRDFLTPEKFPYRVYLQVYPDAELTPAGEVVNRSQNLSRPLLLTSVHRGHLAIASAPLRPGESLELEGVSIRFPEIRPWAEMTYVSDVGVPVFFLGMALGLTGLAGKLWRGR